MRYKALVLNDYENAHFATWVKEGRKKIETRMNRLFSYRGKIIICCGASKSVTENAGLALCIVEIWKGRPMQNTPEEIEAACIGWHKDRKSLLLRNWEYFNKLFPFACYATQKNFQGIFEIELPHWVSVIPQPQILPFNEPELNNLFQ